LGVRKQATPPVFEHIVAINEIDLRVTHGPLRSNIHLSELVEKGVRSCSWIGIYADYAATVTPQVLQSPT
jgi:hypothetical protein